MGGENRRCHWPRRGLLLGLVAASPIALAGSLEDRNFFGRERVPTGIMEAGQNVVDSRVFDSFLCAAILLRRTRLMLDKHAVVVFVRGPIDIEQVEAVGT